MKSQSSKTNWAGLLALLLALPTAYFIFISILKYQLNVNGPFDSIYPALENMGVKESIGWNINLLIIFGPLLALLICLIQVLKLRFTITEDSFHLDLSIRKKPFPIGVVLFSGLLMLILFSYLFLENCNCH